MRTAILSLTTHPLVEPRLTADQINLLLAYALRVPEFFAQAQTDLRSNVFNIASEPHYYALWDTALSLAKKHGPKVLLDDPVRARSLLETELEALFANRPEICNEEFQYRLFNCEFAGAGLLSYIYEYVKPDQLYLPQGVELLRKFRYEREVVDTYRRLFNQAGDAILVQLPDVNRQMMALTAQLDRTGVSECLTGDWVEFERRLQYYRGRDLIGLRTGLKALDERTLGLRGLLVLGAAPGVGKTSLSLQVGLGVCDHNPDAAFIVFSLEMDRWALYTRMLCGRARLDWKTVMLGSEGCRGKADGPWFNASDQQRLEAAAAELRGDALGSRVFILDRTALGEDLTAAKLSARVEQCKARAKVKQALVVVDYLQRLPVPSLVTRGGELEADRHRVQLLQDLAAATQSSDNPLGDAVLVISETRKPSGGRNWGHGLADLMGSARIGYAADAVLLYRPLDDGEVESYGWPTVAGGVSTLAALDGHGVTPVRLELVKGRDGMQRGGWAMAFHYRQSYFTEAEAGAGGDGPVMPLVDLDGLPAVSDPLNDPYADIDFTPD